MYAIVIFFACNRKWHYPNQYPDDTVVEEGVQMLHVDEEYPDEEEYVSHFVFVQRDPRHNHIPSTCVILDSCSTMFIFKTKAYVTNIGRGKLTMTALTNGSRSPGT